MARTPSISDEQILEAAREVFFEQGLQATTAEIARRAGISEGTIFRRFPTKHDLFMAAMGVPAKPAWVATLEEYRGADGPLRDRLVRLANEMIAFFEDLLPKTSLMMGGGVHPAEIFEAFGEPPPVLGVKMLANFFGDEQRAGRLRRCDAEIAARMFLGMLHNYAFFEYMGLHAYLPMPRQTYVRGAVENLLRGLQPDADTTD